MLTIREVIDRVQAIHGLNNVDLVMELHSRGLCSGDPSNISRWKAMPPENGPGWQVTLALLELAGWVTPEASVRIREVDGSRRRPNRNGR